jgi:hypothetical protein
MSHPDPSHRVDCVDCGEPCDDALEGIPTLCDQCLAAYRADERAVDLAQWRESEPPGATE